MTKLNTKASGAASLVYSTYLGGSGDLEGGKAIAVDNSGNAYVFGETDSSDFPLQNGLQGFQGMTDAFVTKLNTNASGAASLVFSTYLGGKGAERGFGIAVDATGNTYVMGVTDSTDFPLINQFQGDQAGFDLFVTKVLTSPSQLLNISTRLRVLTGDQVLIGGFIITGTEPKKVIIRGIGPSLSGTGTTLADPTLELHLGNTTIATNDNWKEHEADVVATTIPPTNDLESAIVTTLDRGAYTAILAGKDLTSGVGLVEVYDLAQSANSKLANISTRGFVDTGDNVMIGGVIVGGGFGGGATRVLVRAIGPSLTGSGVSGALQDPTLELHDGNGAIIATNDNWKSDQRAEIEATTIPPTDDLESAMVRTLTPGAYTAIVRGKNNTTGVALIEVYDLQ